jgi:hypothetical protein
MPSKAGATGSTGVWGAATQVVATNGGFFTGVSCSSAANCTAVGHDSNGPMYATESAGVWGATNDVSAHGSASEFYAASCTAATNCTAVGYNGNDQPFYATESSGVWGAAFGVSGGGGDGLDGVSCTTSTNCTAVGFGVSGNTEFPIYATESSGEWGGVTSTAGGSYFDGVSCSDATDCTAVGLKDSDFEPIYATESSQDWGAATEVPAPGGGYFNGVSCTAVTNCTAVGLDRNGEPIYATSTVDGAPTTPTISNLPASGSIGGNFTATVSTNGDGTTSVTSNSTGICTVSGLVVTYVADGTCSLTAHVAAGINYGPATGVAQTFSVTPPPPALTVRSHRCVSATPERRTLHISSTAQRPSAMGSTMPGVPWPLECPNPSM